MLVRQARELRVPGLSTLPTAWRLDDGLRWASDPTVSQETFCLVVGAWGIRLGQPWVFVTPGVLVLGVET